MVKVRPGSRKGKTKLVGSVYKAARKKAAQNGKSFNWGRYVVQDAMRSAWDDKRSAAGNLSRVGLRSNVNTVDKWSAIPTIRKTNLSRRRKGRGLKNEMGVNVNDSKGLQVREQLEQYAALGEREAKQVVRPGEKVALQRLVAKHGSNWTAMSRDIKLNYLQWTPTQLRNKIERMHSILATEKEQ